jgi:hypothetical protein
MRERGGLKMSLRVQPDSGPPIEFLEGGSRLTFEESPEALIRAAVIRLRASNKQTPARPKSVAVTHLDEALLWLGAYTRGEIK